MQSSLASMRAQRVSCVSARPRTARGRHTATPLQQRPTVKPAREESEQPTHAELHPTVYAAAASEPEGFTWGANMKTLGISVGLGVLVWFLPAPTGVSAQAWHLLAIFVSTIVGIITTPLPLGAVAMLGLGAAMVTKTLTFKQAFLAFSNEIPCAPAPCNVTFACKQLPVSLAKSSRRFARRLCLNHAAMHAGG